MNSSRHWLRLLRGSGGLPRGTWPRVAAVTAVSPLMSPLRLAERVRYGRLIDETRIEKPPIFIVGHWRTGTTLLHNMMCQDPAFGFVSLYQTLVPSSCLMGQRLLRPVLGGFVPDRRPMDNMALALDLPQEEEYAVCNLCDQSFYAGWTFPKRMRELFHKYVLMDGLPEHELRAWKEVYLSVVKKATRLAGGRPLVLKNPVNTARIPLLLELFPGAKFVHVRRNPYEVYRSTQKLHRSIIDLVGLQLLSDLEIEDNVLYFYQRLMQRFFDQQHLVPHGHITEIRYEDLERQPVLELARIYAELDLPGWATARPRVEAHIATQAQYEKNRHSLSPQDAARIQHEWQFALDRWGYAAPETA